ncbi:MAG TPA: CDP-alcohol phosphatidyltransferase family protein [Pilimelia sp.]|nr:CDP-alcohol phosphatidyltransferase family protein [Pilimelia sp.]
MAKIFSGSARTVVSRLIDPVVRGLLRLGVTPNAVTVAGTIGCLVGALGFGARGRFIEGALIVTVSALTDAVDGAMARAQRGPGAPPSRFGALLDSTMDRVADSAVFCAVAYWYATTGDDRPSLVAALLCLVSGGLVSYVKARAEGLGVPCDVGFAERTERLVLVGIGGLATGLGLEWGLPAALWLLAAISVFTVGQRMAHVYRTARAMEAVDQTP